MPPATLAPAPIRPIRSPEFEERIAPILIRIPAVERPERSPTREGPRRRRLRREVRGVLWVLLGTVLGWAVSAYRAAPAPDAAIDPVPVLVRLSIAEDPSAAEPTDEPVGPIALKGFVLPSEAR